MSYAEAVCRTSCNYDSAADMSAALMTENFDTAKYHLEKCAEYAQTLSLPESILLCLRVSLSIADAYRKLSPETNLLNLPDVITLMAIRKPEQIQELLKNNMVTFIEKLSVRENHIYQDSFVEMKKYITDHYRDIDFSFQQMADRFGVSLPVLSRRFNEYSGESLTEYTTALKINMAKEMLCSTGMSINEIGMEVGYYSPNSFIRRFKQITGYSPGEYRKLNQTEE